MQERQRKANEKAAANIVASARSESDIVLPLSSTCQDLAINYLPYQRAGVAYAMDKPGVLLADEMGPGKTIQAIGMSNADPSCRSVLIICLASLKTQLGAGACVPPAA